MQNLKQQVDRLEGELAEAKERIVTLQAIVDALEAFVSKWTGPSDAPAKKQPAKKQPKPKK